LAKLESLWEIGIDAVYRVELLPEIQSLRQAIEQAEKKEPHKEWVGLTDEEILSAAEEVPITCIRQRDYDLHFAPIIEAKLKEKNGG